MIQPTLPNWLQAMIHSRAGAAQGMRWFTPQERAAATQNRDSTFPGRNAWMTDEQREAAEEGWQNKIQVGVGPATYMDHAVSVRLALWLDTEQPDTLWAGLEHHPQFLWFPVGRDAATMAAALWPYLPRDLAQPRQHVNPLALVRNQRQAAQGPIPGAAAGQEKWVRLMVGIAQAQMERSLSEVENHLLMTGVADPRFLLQGTSQDNPRSNPAVTVVRTLYSRSTVRLDWYDSLEGTLFAKVSYAPAGQADTIRAFNDRFQLHYPLDMPVDVPALLLGLEAITVPAIHAYLTRRRDQPELVQYYMYFLAILSDPDIAEPLRPYATHPSPLVRGTVIALAAQRAPELLRAMRRTERDPEHRARIDEALAG